MVESLVPIFVWVLEGLASCKAQLRDREEEAEREKAEREELLERYQAEKALRKESQEVGNDGFWSVDVARFRLPVFNSCGSMCLMVLTVAKSFCVIQRYLELDDQIEQERRAMRARDKERERRERDLEKKAREQADQCEYLNTKYLGFSHLKLNVLCLSRSGGLRGTEGEHEQRTEHTEAYPQQGQILPFSLKSVIITPYHKILYQ